VSGPDWLAAIFLWLPVDTAPFLVPALFVGLLTAWVMISPIAAILLSAGDEQSCLMIAPSQALVRAGHGLDAIQLVGVGSLIGLFLLATLLPLAAPFLATLHHALAPHLGWMLWCAVLFLALGERPRSAPTALSTWDHITYTMTPVLAGLTTLLFSGLLGLMLFYRSPIPLTSSIMNFIPAIMGLFTVPGLLMHVGAPIFPHHSDELRVNRVTTVPHNQEVHLFHAITCGTLSGMITALIPALTGSMSALWTQYLVGPRNARTHLVAQGINRMLYYGAGLILLFLPGAPRMRSSSAALLQTFYEPTPAQAWMMAAVITLSALTAWFLLPVCAKSLLGMIARHGTRPMALAALFGILTFVGCTTSWPGLLILLTATGIGMLPVLFQASSIQGMGVVLIPLACALTK